MNVISSGENDVSWDAFKLTLLMYQSLPLTSKYKLAVWILSAIIFSLKFVFCNRVFDESIVVIVWETELPFIEPLKNTFK